MKSASSASVASLKTMLRVLARRLGLSCVIRFWEWLDYRLVAIHVRNGFLASIYYALFNSTFYREHRAVLSGRLAYLHSRERTGATSALLRRNTHRLEKGLIMRPRRPVFAEDYILETVNHFQHVLSQGALDQSEMDWVEQVLQEYFRVIHETPTIARARQEFSRLTGPSHANECIPYCHGSLAPTQVSYDHLSALFRRRRSVRWYLDRKVAPELIERAVDIATLAPSACNRQPFYFLVLYGESASKIAELAGGTQGYSHNIPCLVVVTGELQSYSHERDRHLIYIDGGLVSMQLMLALETLGLSTCAINWPDVSSRENQMQELLGLEVYERPIMLISVGYADPDGGVPFSQKKPARVLVRAVTIPNAC